MLPIAVLAGLAAGLVLGLLGSGGTIITLPALIFLLSVPTKPAVAMTLGIVGVTSGIAAVCHWRRGNLNLPVAAIFGAFSAGGSFLGAKIGLATPAVVQLILFAAVMYIAAWLMYRPLIVESKRGALQSDFSGGFTLVYGDAARVGGIAAMGTGVGMLTGLIGIGGGFLIVPALVLQVGLEMKEAVGTSLAIITVNTFVGFSHYVGAVPLDGEMMAVFTGVAIAGSLVGTVVSNRISASSLKRGFAVFLIVMATYIIARQSWGNEV